MRQKLSTMILTAAVVAVCVFASQLFASGNTADEIWVTTWSAANVSGLGPPANAGFDNRTLRHIVRTSVGGKKVRVSFSAFGAGALLILSSLT